MSHDRREHCRKNGGLSRLIIPVGLLFLFALFVFWPTADPDSADTPSATVPDAPANVSTTHFDDWGASSPGIPIMEDGNHSPTDADAVTALIDRLYPNGRIIARSVRASGHHDQERIAVLLNTPEHAFPIRIEIHRDTVHDRVLWFDEMAGDRVIVGWDDDEDAEVSVRVALVRNGFIDLVELADGTWMAQTSNPEPWSVPDLISAMDGLPGLRYAEPDGIIRLDAAPNDPAFVDGLQWGLENTGQSGGTAGYDIGAVMAWDIATDAPEIVIAVIDSGARYTHEDLAANMWHNPGETDNGIDDDGNGYIDDIHGINRVTTIPANRGNPMDDHGHGSHVSGIAAAVGNNGAGISGVAWNVRIMALKFLSSSGTGTVSGALASVNYARQNGARVINASWGRDSYSQALYDAMAECRDTGILIVAAAGNDSRNLDTSPRYPAAFDLENIIAVASMDRRGYLSSFSDWSSSRVDLAAPGSSIYSVDRVSDSSYRHLSGTSMAAPHVAGSLSLVAAIWPQATGDQLRDVVLENVQPNDRLAGKVRTGGHLDLAAALDAANVLANSAPTVTLTLHASPTDGGTVVGAGDYAPNDSVEISAFPAPGYYFDFWTGFGVEVPDEGLTTIVMGEEDAELVAHFAPFRAVTADSIPADGGSVFGNGLYRHGETVELEAVPAIGYRFSNWSGIPSEIITTNPVSFEVTSDVAAYAVFEREVQIEIEGTVQTYTGAALTVLPVVEPSVQIEVRYDGAIEPPVDAGDYMVTVVVVEDGYYGSATATMTILPAEVAITLGSLTQVFDGGPKEITATTSPFGISTITRYNGEEDMPVYPGEYSVEVFVNDPNYTGSASGTLSILNANAAIDLGGLEQVYNGGSITVSAVTDPPGLATDIRYNGSSTPPTNAGDYLVEAVIDDQNYTGFASGMLKVSPAPALISLSDLERVYSGEEISATAQTEPTGLGVTVRYNGEPTLPVNAGTYAVEAHINDPNYTGATSAELTILPASAAIMLDGLEHGYTGQAVTVHALTDPPNITTDITYDGHTTAPTEVGSYAVSATVNDPNHTGSANGTLTIVPAEASVVLSGLEQVYSGSAVTVNVETSPPGLAVVIHYDGALAPPVSAGTYEVEAFVDDSNYAGTAKGTLSIAPATATVSFSDLQQVYTGEPLPVALETSPPGLTTVVSYDGNPAPPISAGTYSVVASIDDPNYAGSASAVFRVAPISATIALSGLRRTYTGQPFSVDVETAPPGLPVSVEYNGEAAPPIEAGMYQVNASIEDHNYSGTASAVLIISRVSVSPESVSILWPGAVSTLQISTFPLVHDWSAVSSVEWITFQGAQNGTGPGTIGFTIEANRTAISRSGWITVGYASVRIDQDPRRIPMLFGSNGVVLETLPGWTLFSHGRIFDDYFPFIYYVNSELGRWFYAFGDDPSGVYMWDYSNQQWRWTSSAIFPWAYCLGRSQWCDLSQPD